MVISFGSPHRIEIGPGCLNRSGDLAKSLGASKVLVVMDAYLASPQIGLNDKLQELLKNSKLSMAIYSDITGEPSSKNVAEGARIANESASDCVLALGGGSTIDAAKAIAVKAVNPDLVLSAIPNMGNLRRLPLIAIPTTSGTGSEGTKVCVITNEATGVKENPGHLAMIPDIAVLDPELTKTMPRIVSAFTGMDALTHAMEAYVSNKATLISDLYAIQAIKLIREALPGVMADGNDTEKRQDMAIASCFAGIAFSNASTNLAHAAGRALGACLHVPHGLSVALFLPFVMEFGLEVAEDRYANVALALGADPCMTKPELARKAVQIVEDFNDRFGIWVDAKNRYFSDIEKYRKNVQDMAKNAMAGNGILTNLKVPTEKDVIMVFDKLAEKMMNV